MRPPRLTPVLLALAFLACATSTVPIASDPIDWAAVAGEEVPVLVTRDADGDLRETKLWLAVVDGEGYVRTGSSRWFRNLEREPDAWLRIGGAAYAVRASPATDPAVVARVNEAFRAKYGFQDRMVAVFGVGANVMRLSPRRVD